ncbi:MAG: acyltransferase domain-containing protein, partial [Vulcanimicrobiaceae bacterium]
MRAQPALPLEAVAATLQRGRRHFAQRSALVAATVDEAIAKLETGPRRDGSAGEPPTIAFLFPGQGSQYVGMGRDLYLHAPVFREAFDRCAALAQRAGIDLPALLYRADANDGEAALRATAHAQPALFAVEYALAQLFASFGIEPVAMVGHSIGELVAATLAGVFSLEDAVAFAAERGRLMQALEPGTMLAVRLGAAELEALLPAQVEIAAENAPELCVASGPAPAVAALAARLDERGVVARPLHTSHAFHSAMVEPIVAPLRELVARMALAPPRLRFVSTVTGRWIGADEATSPDYWARHARERVRFAPALATVVAEGVRAFLELGPGATLATLALQGAARGTGSLVLGALPGPDEPGGALAGALEALGRLWTCGAQPRWAALHERAPRTISLPTYPFERTPHWIEHRASANDSTNETGPPSGGQGAPMDDSTSAAETTARDAASTMSDTERASVAIVALLEELSGDEIAGADPQASFLELGFDSLFLGRFSQQLQARFGIAVSFRELMGAYPSIGALAERLAPAFPAPAVAVSPAQLAQSAPASAAGEATSLEALMRSQLEAMQQLFREQLAAVARSGGGPPAAAAPQ